MHGAVVADERFEIRGALAAGFEMSDVMGDPDPRIRHRGANRGRGSGVGEVRVMRGTQRIGPPATARRMLTRAVAHLRERPWLVERDPGVDTVTEAARHEGRVVGEPIDDLRLQPASAVLQLLWQVPVVEGQPRLDPAIQQPVDEAVVEVQAGLIAAAGAAGLNAWPRDAEAIGPQAHLGHEVEVVAPSPVVVARDVAGLVVDDPARRVAERVPDARAASIEVHRTFDLVGGGCRAPRKVRVGSARPSARRAGAEPVWDDVTAEL